MNFSALVVESITDWIDHNIHQPLRIEEVARYAGYSKWHFQRLFLDCKGTSLGRYIRQKKLYLAAGDLLNTQERIVDIAMKYGFESQQSFNRLFTRTYSVSPGNYRRLRAKNSQRPDSPVETKIYK